MGRKITKNTLCKGCDFLVADEHDAVFWAKGSTQHYLSAPTKIISSAKIPSHGGRAPITAPKDIKADTFKRYGITAIAYTVRTSNFYHFVNLSNYADFQFVLSGMLSFKTEKNEVIAKAGQTLVLPKGTIGRLRILSNNTKIFWINAGAKSEICKCAGNEVSVRKFVSFREMTDVLYLYYKEAYTFGDPLILENYAAAFYALLIRNLAGSHQKGPKADALKNIVYSVKKTPSKSPTAESAAKKMRVSVYELNRLSRKIFGANFTKAITAVKMAQALRLLKSKNLSCALAAKKTGYKSQFSFSRAFKKYHNVSPSKIKAGLADSRKTT